MLIHTLTTKRSMFTVKKEAPVLLCLLCAFSIHVKAVRICKERIYSFLTFHGGFDYFIYWVFFCDGESLQFIAAMMYRKCLIDHVRSFLLSNDVF